MSAPLPLDAPSTAQIAPIGVAAYAAQLAALLPTGRAWPRENGSVLMALVRGMADELARIDGRASDLFEEVDPRTTLELLADWERAAGLPDACTPAPDSISERQAALLMQLTALGGQSRAWFTACAAALGYAITIDEFQPFRMLSRIGERLGSEAWAHNWRINVLPPATDTGEGFTLRYFRMGSRMGERLVGFGSIDFECVMRRARPAHTSLLFAYQIEPQPLVWFDFTA